MTILGMKLVTGEEVIAEVENSGDNRYKLIDPVMIRIVAPQIPGGAPSMGFVPFPPFGDPSVKTAILEPLHVVYSYTPVTDILDNYRQYTTGIVTASKQIITG